MSEKCIRCGVTGCEHTELQKTVFWQAINLICVNCGRKGHEFGPSGIEKECACLNAHPMTLDVPHAPLCWSCFNQSGGVCWSCELNILNKPKNFLDELNEGYTP